MPRPTDTPRVGVSLSPDSAERTRQNYLNAVRAGGCEAVPLDTDDDSLLASIAELDAIVLSGGGDLNPELYGEDPSTELMSVDDQRDRFEVALVRKARAADLPILGICRGHQLLNVALGGMMVQHIDNPIHHTREGGDRETNSSWHPTRIEPGSHLYEVYGAERITTNSRHHQGILPAMLAPGLKATAFSEDGYVEGFEGDGLLGIQWHPERVESADRDGFNEQSKLLFQYFKRLVEDRSAALARK